jgi:hypothetical protein
VKNPTLRDILTIKYALFLGDLRVLIERSAGVAAAAAPQSIPTCARRLGRRNNTRNAAS